MCHMPQLHRALLALLIIGAIADAAVRGPNVSVTKQPATFTTKTFDPANPPAEMPQLQPGEAAQTQYTFGITVGLTYVPSADNDGGNVTASIRVNAIQLKTSLSIVEFLPPNAPAQLKAHENGHRRIAETFYKDAEPIAQKIGQKYVGGAYDGHGADFAAAKQDAVNRLSAEITKAYMESTRIPAMRVNDLFDQITDHGRKRIAVDEATRQAMEKYREERDSR